jgi:hypothetical protein
MSYSDWLWLVLPLAVVVTTQSNLKSKVRHVTLLTIFVVGGIWIVYDALVKTYEARWGYAIFQWIMAIAYGFIVLYEYDRWVESRKKTDA